MPAENKATEKAVTPPYFYNRRHPKVMSAPVGKNRLYDVYGFDYKDGELSVVKTGVYNPQEDINAMKTESIQELLNKMPGKNPLEKVQNAMASGLAPFTEGTDTYDMSNIPNSFVEAKEMLSKAKAQASTLPSDLVNRDLDFKKMLDGLSTDKIMDYIKSKLPKDEKPAAGTTEGGDNK